MHDLNYPRQVVRVNEEGYRKIAEKISWCFMLLYADRAMRSGHKFPGMLPRTYSSPELRPIGGFEVNPLSI